MEIRSVELPGIGKKYTLHTTEGCIIVIIIHHSGRRELYFMYSEDSDEPGFTFDLNDEEARRMGAILLGADYQPMSDERMEFMLKNILVEWIKVNPHSQVANQKIRDAAIRTKTGSTIIGIQRKDEIIGSPDINEVLLPGDVLMAVGKKDQLKVLEKLCSGKES
ncbi:MAG: TrkA C-terminal domain-containing protein [Bacillota bacterium]|jgi:TrkA domain protein|nr:TrkA C-terminal domain-containing protein [Bacillota bacterium]